MPVFEIQSGGKTFEVDAPDEQSALKAAQAPNGAYTGKILPLSRDASGRVSFDSNAGILGDLKRSLLLPGQYVEQAQQPKTTVSDSDVSPLSVPSVMGLASAGTPVSPGARLGEGAALVGAERVKEKPSVPTAEALQAAAARGYDSARNSGLQIRPEAVTGLMGQLRSRLEQDGIFDQLAPKTFAIIDKASSAPEGSYATVANLEAIRRSLQLASRDFSNPTEQLASSRAIRGLDGLLEGLSASSVVARSPASEGGLGALPPPVPSARPSPEDIAKILKDARGNYAAAQRSNSLTGVLDRANTGILERAESRAQAANSGRNLDNTIRSKVASLLEKPKEVSGFSDKELAALNEVIVGGGPRNTARYVGNLLGGGGGIGQSIVGLGGATAGGITGSMTGSPALGVAGAVAGLAPAITGSGAKAIANILAKKSLGRADELVRANSPLYRDALAAAPVTTGGINTRAAIAKILLMNAMQGNGE